jgi:hypothetical protein
MFPKSARPAAANGEPQISEKRSFANIKSRPRTQATAPATVAARGIMALLDDGAAS